jgi:phosphonate transport system substrate-binding protein
MKMNRRNFLVSASVVAGVEFTPCAAPRAPFRFGLTLVFMTYDKILVDGLRRYLASAMARPVELVLRKTYKEIAELLVAGGSDAACICGYRYLRNKGALTLLTLPVWNARPLYRSCLIARADHDASDLLLLGGDLHAFADLNSYSGFLVTPSALVARNQDRNRFFKKGFSSYGHRNVMRTGASGHAQSGSVGGYVWKAVSITEPDLTAQTKVVWKSKCFGFPPIACRRDQLQIEPVRSLQTALINMSMIQAGMAVQDIVQLDGFSVGVENPYDAIPRPIEVLDAAT